MQLSLLTYSFRLIEPHACHLSLCFILITFRWPNTKSSYANLFCRPRHKYPDILKDALGYLENFMVFLNI